MESQAKHIQLRPVASGPFQQPANSVSKERLQYEALVNKL